MARVECPDTSAPLGNKTNTQNGVRFVLSPVEGRVPLLHNCAAALRATTLLPNWTRCVDVNKFTHNAIFRGSDQK